MTLARPEKLPWVTTSLIVNIVLGALGVLMLPFVGALLNFLFGMSASSTDLSADDVAGLNFARVFTGATLWISAFLGLAWLAFEFFALKAVQQGRAWGRTAAIVIFVFALFNFPFGTIVGIFGLIGALDPEVQRYTSR
ncbi:hypothetical protein [Deinococcus yavapaiensis]|uniref:Uncharacterized protein n=1 Tax=Deinococcus yavapaiensis KR-236 TaxID=694435 RepID=A0A318SGG3_9DEIO|nr:hypothetical protein [Deinococcus yavapaiensis]PYE55986.1 hypothetical protein DES52_102354 [Deinococcus yavapaiensis KR-236]